MVDMCLKIYIFIAIKIHNTTFSKKKRKEKFLTPVLINLFLLL